MAFSYARIILEDCEYPIFLRGKELSRGGRVSLVSTTNNSCTAEVKGGDVYEVRLGFSKVGSPKYTCTCPYVTKHKTKLVCKHVVAAAIVWDAERTILVPSEEDAKLLCLEEPELSHGDIQKAYADPLKADLHVLRDTAAKLGQWSRGHARLPDAPSVCREGIVTPETVQRGLQEIRNWSHRSNFDPYFCVGEMMAAFCELVRWARSSAATIPNADCLDIVEQLVRFQRDLIFGMIDDSDGLHEFRSAHLMALISEIDKPQIEDKRRLALLSERAHSIEW